MKWASLTEVANVRCVNTVIENTLRLLPIYNRTAKCHVKTLVEANISLKAVAYDCDEPRPTELITEC